jgi:hypothetical protein
MRVKWWEHLVIFLVCLFNGPAFALAPQQAPSQSGQLNLTPKPKPTKTNHNVWKIPQSSIDKVTQPDFRLPLTFALPPVFKSDEGTLSSPNRLTIRLLQATDIPQVIELCTDEYGRPKGLPCWSQLSLHVILNYLDDLALRPLLETSLRMKLNHGPSFPKDHAVLVLSADCSNNPLSDNLPKIIGMIEVSRQPVIPDRNPPAFPIPLWMKRLTSFYNSVASTSLSPEQLFNNQHYQEPQGWISNLLVAPSYRQHGCAKLLVCACEGIAVHAWKCSSIHLHCDAHPQRGKAGQALYTESLNYHTIQQATIACTNGIGVTSRNQFSTRSIAQQSTESILGQSVGPATWNSVSSSIFIVQGVPLLYLQKHL